MRLIVINREKLKMLLVITLSFIIVFSISRFIHKGALTAIRTPMENMVIMIDPGHGGMDPGASGKSGVTEDKINLQIALKLKLFIEQSGGTALMTREDEKGLYSENKSTVREKKNEDLKKRREAIINSNADVFVSIHLNSFSQSKYYGAQTFYQEGSEEGRKLSELIQKQLVEILDNDNHRVAKSINSIYILKDNNIPGALVECGFLSNPEEEKLLQDDAYQQKIAWAIFSGIMRYLR